MVVAAWACIAVLLYTYAGYPLLIAAAARLFPRPVRRDDEQRPMVSVCIAAYNVAATLDAKLASVTAQDWPQDKLEVLVYVDGSTDDTAAIAEAWARRDGRVRVLGSTERRGKPTGLNRMREEARGEILVLTDARQPLVPGAVAALVAPLGDPSVGCVTGNLVLEGDAGSGAYWRYENWIRRNESAFRGVVGMTGPLSALRREDMPVLPLDIVLDDVWIPMSLPRGRRRVILSPEAIARDRAFDDGREFGRKVRTLAGNYQLFARLPWVLVPFVSPAWFEIVSHKIMRLLCPWALVALLGISTAGAAGSPALAALLVAQLAGYGAALLGPRLGKPGRLGRTFVVLNAAALLGLVRFATGRQKITW